MAESWVNRYRPGFFGRRKPEIIASLNQEFGEHNWRLVWVVDLRHLGDANGQREFSFDTACHLLYEESYYRHLKANPDLLSKITEFGEVYDNAPTNVQSGLDYEKQESYSTHIQDIAIRNTLVRLGMTFKGSKTNLLQVRGPDSVGHQLGLNPGQVKFWMPEAITQPSIRPGWAQEGSVEDLWQSNKWVQIKVEVPQ